MNKTGLQKVTIFAFNDFHRRLNPFPDGSGGAAKLVGKLRELKANHPDSLTVNVGDVAGDNRKHGPQAFAPIAELFDRAQVDVLALGNHEFEDSADNYASLRDGLIAPFNGEVLCANIKQTQNGQAIEGTKPFTIKQLAGFNIALLGVVTRDLSSKMHPLAGAGLSVVPIEDSLAALVPQLDAQSDAVVVLGHENIREMARHTEATPGIDVTLAAHDHQLVKEEVVRADGSKAYVSEGGAYGQTINQIDLYFDPQSRKLITVEMTTHGVDANSPVDAQAEEIVRNAPVLERAEKPEKPSRRDAPSFSSFSELSEWFNTKGNQPQ